MAENPNIELVQRCYAAFNRGDIEGLINLCSEDVSWGIDSVSSAPWSGVRRGKEGVREFFQKVNEGMEFRAFNVRDFAAAGSCVYAQVDLEWVAKSTGVTSRWTEVHVMQARDGKITSFRAYFDTLGEQQALERRVSKPGRPQVTAH